MIIPETVNVFHLTYQVRHVGADVIGPGTCGHVDTGAGQILILDSMPHQFKVDTFVHELVHAHLLAIGQKDDEEIVHAITTAILTFLKLNAVFGLT